MGKTLCFFQPPTPSATPNAVSVTNDASCPHTAISGPIEASMDAASSLTDGSCPRPTRSEAFEQP